MVTSLILKDIGVIVDIELKFDKHINNKIDTANKISHKTLIFTSMCRYTFAIYISRLQEVILITCYDTLESSLVKHLESIERIQRRATKMIPPIIQKD